MLEHHGLPVQMAPQAVWSYSLFPSYPVQNFQLKCQMFKNVGFLSSATMLTSVCWDCVSSLSALFCVRVFLYVCTHVGARGQCQVSSCLFLYLTSKVSHWTQSSPIWLIYPASELRNPPVSIVPSLGSQAGAAMPSFIYTDAGNLNSSLHAFLANMWQPDLPFTFYDLPRAKVSKPGWHGSDL